MLLLAATLAFAHHGEEAAAAPKPNPSFEALKALAGTWTGTAQHGGDPMPAEVTYRVSGSGTSVIETLFPGSDHEMVTVYYPDGDVGVMLTHFCASGNQPRLKLDPKSPAGTMHFAYVDATNLKKGDYHMHEGTVTVVDGTHLKESWLGYAAGKPAGAAEFTLERAPKP